MIEQFTKEDFEAALPAHKETDVPLCSEGKMKSGEWTYFMPIDDKVGIEIRSSVDRTGVAAAVGQDSIRAWLVNAETGRCLGSKVSKWTTRVPGWDRRLKDVLRTLWTWRKQAGNCPACGEPKGIFKVKKEGPNKGRIFSQCREHKNFTWLS